jgi:ribosomal protein L37AE/L43A
VKVEHTTLTRASWQCTTCGKTLNRGDRIRVTIAAGIGTNRVEHDPECPLDHPSPID